MTKEDIIKEYNSVIDNIKQTDEMMQKNWDIPKCFAHQTELLIYAQTQAITGLCKAICYERMGVLEDGK
jgi:hypothetical protein